MSPDEFDRLVAAAYARIPARFRKRLKNVAMMVEPEPRRRNWRAAACRAGARCWVSTKAGR